MKILGYTFEEYVELVKKFHGHIAPGMVCGGFMIELAYQNLEEGGFYDAISETPACIPDAVQILTPCTIGNGWLKIRNTGRFAVILYDKYNGEGVRVAIDMEALENWSEVKAWALKLRPKKEQDIKLLLSQIEKAGTGLFRAENVTVAETLRGKKKNTGIFICSVCGESFRSKGGSMCPACRGDVVLTVGDGEDKGADLFKSPLSPVPLAEAVGKKALHDMTLIIPRERKGPGIRKGDVIRQEDVELLKSMGKQNVFVDEGAVANFSYVHEDEAARSFARKMAGEGLVYSEAPVEGKIDFRAGCDGILQVNKERLERFNSVAGVICATLAGNASVCKGDLVAGTRAIPLFLPEKQFALSMDTLSDPLFQVIPYKRSRVGVIVTGTEVFEGRIEDGFVSLVTERVSQYGCSVVASEIVPDSRDKICRAVETMVSAGAELIIVTGGLSVDPDDVTRFGLVDAGLYDYTYSIPVLPGAMTLTGRIGDSLVLGVPAGALFSPQTAFDLLLPCMLASWKELKGSLPSMGHGGLLRDSEVINSTSPKGAAGAGC